jgi:Ca2+-binding EF-hand superfamily protein
LITDYSLKDQSKVKVRSAAKSEETGKYIALWVRRVNCRNTVHNDGGAWYQTAAVENTGATGAARWVALGRSEVEAMQGKLKYRKTPEEEEERTTLFNLIDVNGNGFVSLAEIDKALPELMGCVALFNAKPAIIRAFMAAVNKPLPKNDDQAFKKHSKDYIYAGEQFRVLIQYLHEFFQMYLIFQDIIDTDEDRRIDCQEWANFITSGNAERVGIEVTPQMLEDKCGETPMAGYSVFNEIDTDQAGCILFKEFSDFCIRKGIKDSGKNDGLKKLRELFYKAKDLEDGVSYDMFRAVLINLGVAAEDVQQIIEQTDENYNGAIDIDEFVQYLKGYSLPQEAVESAIENGRGRIVCKIGCGMYAASGFTRSGKPRTTCCKGCASTGEHDDKCDLVPVAE